MHCFRIFLKPVLKMFSEFYFWNIRAPTMLICGVMILFFFVWHSFRLAWVILIEICMGVGFGVCICVFACICISAFECICICACGGFGCFSVCTSALVVPRVNRQASANRCLPRFLIKDDNSTDYLKDSPETIFCWHKIISNRCFWKIVNSRYFSFTRFVLWAINRPTPQ